jgi:hypothetical protein
MASDREVRLVRAVARPDDILLTPICDTTTLTDRDAVVRLNATTRRNTAKERYA